MIDLDSEKRMTLLAKKWQDNSITEQEKKEFETWYNSFDNIYEIDSEETFESTEKRLYNKILLKAGINRKKSNKIWYRLAAACIIILCASIALFLQYQQTNNIENNKVVKTTPSVITSPENKATLILANGKRISLTDASIGEVANEFGVKIDKTADGQLIYTISDVKPDNADVFNTIETPRGGSYQVNLPDGSKVWLNAASKLRYPVRFGNNERKIELTGEAYFEVASQVKENSKNEKMPFIVQTGNQRVEVLGTHFNISAYEDETDIRTTLLEGSVMVSSASGKGRANSKLLVPGQTAVYDLQNLEIGVQTANVRSVMAWKKGYFIFDNENIRDIMKKLSRWYDIEVEYYGNVDDIEFQANYMRSRSIVNLLKTLELTNKIKFKIDGRRITVIGEHYK